MQLINSHTPAESREREKKKEISKMNTENLYNGWKNRQTWNCALWIGNNEPLYHSAVSFMKRYKGKAPYKNFIISMGAQDDKTPDDIKWLSDALDYAALNEMMKDLP